MSRPRTMDRTHVFETARPSQPSVSRVRRPRLFGQYLVEEGVVEQSDVREALALMRLVNSPVGEIAIGEGLLSAAQVDRILDEQRRVDGHFFELAASLGFASRALKSLCSVQAVDNLRFGDALVEIDAITSTSLEEHLQAYDAEEHFAAPCLPPSAAISAKVTARLFPRLACRAIRSAVRFSSARTWDGTALDLHATATLPGPGGIAVGLSVADSVAVRLSPDRDLRRSDWTRQLAPLLLADFVGLVVSVARAELEGVADLTGDVKLSPNELPVRGVCFDVAFAAGPGVLIFQTP